MLLMFESGIRGGFSGVLGNRYAKANNKYMKKYNDKEPSTYLLHKDCVNLYGGGMMQPLPIDDFKWEYKENYYKKPPKGRGCIVEVDLKYTDRSKIATYKFPLAPKNKVIQQEQLSTKQHEYLLSENRTLGKVPKLILDLHDKEKYVIHYKLLQYYEKLGLKVIKVHRTISFKESDWLKKYIV